MLSHPVGRVDRKEMNYRILGTLPLRDLAHLYVPSKIPTRARFIWVFTVVPNSPLSQLLASLNFMRYFNLVHI